MVESCNKTRPPSAAVAVSTSLIAAHPLCHFLVYRLRWTVGRLLLVSGSSRFSIFLLRMLLMFHQYPSHSNGHYSHNWKLRATNLPIPHHEDLPLDILQPKMKIDDIDDGHESSTVSFQLKLTRHSYMTQVAAKTRSYYERIQFQLRSYQGKKKCRRIGAKTGPPS